MHRSNTFEFFELLSTLKLKKLKNSFYLCKKFFNQSALLEHLYFFLIFFSNLYCSCTSDTISTFVNICVYVPHVPSR